MMDAFWNANNFRNKDLRELNPRRSDEQDVVIISFGIPLFQIFVSESYFHSKKSFHHDVTGIIGHKWKRESNWIYE